VDIKRDWQAVVDKYKANSVGFWTEHRFYIYLLIVAGFLDAMSTIHFMLIIGPEAELHPMVRWLSVNYGVVAGPLIGFVLKISLGVVAIIYVRRVAKILFSIGIFLYFFAASYNFFIH